MGLLRISVALINFVETIYLNRSPMRLTIEIPDYTATDGFRCDWCNKFQIATSFHGGVFVIKANKEGLESLAKQLLQLAQKEVPKGYHLHYDEHNSLENGSVEFVIEKD